MWLITKWYHSVLHEPDGRGDGRDMGEIEKISPVLKPLCTEVFQEISGGMRDFLVTMFK